MAAETNHLSEVIRILRPIVGECEERGSGGVYVAHEDLGALLDAAEATEQVRADCALLRAQNAGAEAEINVLIRTNNELIRILKIVEGDIEWRENSPTLRMIRAAVSSFAASGGPTSSPVTDAIKALRTEPLYEDADMAMGVSTCFLMRLTLLEHAAGLRADDDQLVQEARAALSEGK